WCRRASKRSRNRSHRSPSPASRRRSWRAATRGADRLMPNRVDALEAVDGKHAGRVSCGGQAFGIAGEVVAQLGLAIGLEVGGALAAELEAAADRRAAAARILGHLRGRPRTAAEVRSYLARHGHRATAVDSVVAELEQRGLVEDARYASWFVQARLAHRPQGTARLVREMRAKGVPRDLAEQAARQGVGNDEQALALRAARPKLAAVTRLGRERGLRRISAFLAQRGFSDATVREVSLRLFATETKA